MANEHTPRYCDRCDCDIEEGGGHHISSSAYGFVCDSCYEAVVIDREEDEDEQEDLNYSDYY